MFIFCLRSAVPRMPNQGIHCFRRTATRARPTSWLIAAVIFLSMLIPYAEAADASTDTSIEGGSSHNADTISAGGGVVVTPNNDKIDNGNVVVDGYAAKWLVRSGAPTYHDALIKVIDLHTTVVNPTETASNNNILTKTKNPCASSAGGRSEPLDLSGKSADPMCLDTAFVEEGIQSIINIPLSQEATIAAQSLIVICMITNCLSR